MVIPIVIDPFDGSGLWCCVAIEQTDRWGRGCDRRCADDQPNDRQCLYDGSVHVAVPLAEGDDPGDLGLMDGGVEVLRQESEESLDI
jgi:hypothetical protein